MLTDSGTLHRLLVLNANSFIQLNYNSSFNLINGYETNKTKIKAFFEEYTVQTVKKIKTRSVQTHTHKNKVGSSLFTAD